MDEFMREITIAGRRIGDGHFPFTTAEIGVNHDGSLDKAVALIDAAAKTGVQAVKFGAFKADEFCAKSDPLYEVFKRCELPDSAWSTIRNRCVRDGVIFFATPQNYTDLKVLLSVGVPCIKVGSDDLVNYALIESYAANGLPMILSTGMADPWDVRQAVRACGAYPVLVCVCTSEYPCEPENANLRRITTMRGMLDGPVGFSDHTIGSEAAGVAVAFGASYFETHFTLDNCSVGPDHAFSKDPDAMQDWVTTIWKSYVMLGDGEIKPSASERINRDKWRRKTGQQIRGAA